MKEQMTTSKQAGAEPVVAWLPPEHELRHKVGDFINASRTQKEGWDPVYRTPPAVMLAAPSDADEQTPHDIVWAAYEQDLPRARLTVHSSHFNTSAPVWFERGYHAALSQTMQPKAGTDHSQLMKFYGVDSVDALVAAQADHITKLQDRLPRNTAFTVQRVREG